MSDKLAQALRRIKLNAMSLADAQVIALEALAEYEAAPQQEPMISIPVSTWNEISRFQQEPDKLDAERYRACALKYLDMLGVDDPAKALAKDIQNPEMVGELAARKAQL